MKKVWILMSVANEYNQPEKAFEKLFWTKPTLDELREFDFTPDDMERLSKPNRHGEGNYWVEEFTEPV